MGNYWNEKRCRCKTCGLVCRSILAGRIHIWQEHGLSFWKKKIKDYLEYISEEQFKKAKKVFPKK